MYIFGLFVSPSIKVHEIYMSFNLVEGIHSPPVKLFGGCLRCTYPICCQLCIPNYLPDSLCMLDLSLSAYLYPSPVHVPAHSI